MDPAFEELEHRSRYLNSLVRRTRLADPPEAEPKLKAVEPGAGEGKRSNVEAADGKERTKVKMEEGGKAEARKVTVKVPKLGSKRLAFALKKVYINTQIVLSDFSP
jgi:dynein light chain LC8-type